MLHQPLQDRVSQFSPDAAGLDSLNGSVPDKVGHRGIANIDHRAGCKLQMLDPQAADGGEDLSDHLVPLPEAVVEGNGHSISKADPADRLLQGTDQFFGVGGAFPRAAHRMYRRRGGLPLIRAAVRLDLISVDQLRQFASNGISHFIVTIPSSLMPAALA